MALAPKFAELADKYGDRIVFLKLNRADNREIMKKLSLRGVPTIIFMKDGREFAPRLTGDERATPFNIEAEIKRLLNE
jgi:thiol-disulfide isomerase/thioredoxin